jgi:hypothetical protein
MAENLLKVNVVVGVLAMVSLLYSILIPFWHKRNRSFNKPQYLLTNKKYALLFSITCFIIFALISYTVRYIL